MRQAEKTVQARLLSGIVSSLLASLGILLISLLAWNGTAMAQGMPAGRQGVAGHIRWDDARGGNTTGGGQALAGVTVELYAGTCAQVAGSALSTVVTGPGGGYSFLDLAVGDYCLAVGADSLPEFAVTTNGGSTVDVTLEDGQYLQGVDLTFTRALTDDRLVVNLQRPCGDSSWLNSLAIAHSGNLTSASPSGCSFLIQVPPPALDGLSRALQADPRVHDAGLDAMVQGSFVPGDPFYNNPALVYAPQQVNAPGAWDHTLGDEDLIVAVLDTGIDLAHPEFAGRLLPGYDFVNEDSDPRDDSGHGTHVAGILAADIDNGIGIAGIAGRVKILPVKVLNATNNGYMSDVAAGIIWAVDQGARVINLSLGGPAGTPSLENAIAYANGHGTVVVAATGNSNTATPTYPASYTTVLGVGATQPNGARWSLSNYGPNVDVLAPGSMVYSTHWNASEGSRYAFLSGTSMASPHVAGIAALMLSEDPALTPAEVGTMIFDTAADLGDPGHDLLNGYGRVDAEAALETFLISPLATAEPGDCNGDASIDAGDLSALVLEVFDGDGNDPSSAGSSTFPGDPSGCNANEDAHIDAGDFSCLVLVVFLGPGACSGPMATSQHAGVQSHPQSTGLSIPAQIPAQPGGTVVVPILFESGGASISSLLFSLDYDENWLSFDPTDSDGDGMPDAVDLHVPAAFATGVTVDLADGDGELDFVISDFVAPLAPVPGGVIATVTLNVGTPPRSTQAGVGFSVDPPASFGDVQGLSVPGATTNGSVRIDAGTGTSGSAHNLFMPLV